MEVREYVEPRDYEIQPNKNAEAYRNFCADSYTARLEKYLDFIEINEDGFTLLGCSDLTGRYWLGSVWYFSDPGHVPDIQRCLAGTTCESGVTDAKFLADGTKFLVGEDSGALHILAVTEAPEDTSHHISALTSTVEHDGTVMSVSVFPGRKRAVTGSTDLNIKVWNAETLESEHTYRPAHTQQVNSVDTCPTEGEHMFGSCSSDGTTFIWDTRKAKPASVLLRDEDCSYTSLAWQPGKPTLVAVGSDYGIVSLVDVRHTKEILYSVNCSTRAIHRLKFSEQLPDLLAVCADNTDVSIFDCSASEIIYRDDRHEDFVRGLAWHGKTGNLYTCGWDTKVLAHSSRVPPSAGDVTVKMEVSSPSDSSEPRTLSE